MELIVSFVNVPRIWETNELLSSQVIGCVLQVDEVPLSGYCNQVNNWLAGCRLLPRT